MVTAGSIEPFGSRSCHCRRLRIREATPYTSTLEKLKDTLEVAGVEFIAENGGGAGVRLRKAPREQLPEGEAGIIAGSDM